MVGIRIGGKRAENGSTDIFKAQHETQHTRIGFAAVDPKSEKKNIVFRTADFIVDLPYLFYGQAGYVVSSALYCLCQFLGVSCYA